MSTTFVILILNWKLFSHIMILVNTWWT